MKAIDLQSASVRSSCKLAQDAFTENGVKLENWVEELGHRTKEVGN